MEARILSFDLGTANTGFSMLNGCTFPKRELILYDCGMIRTSKALGGSSEVRDRIDLIGGEYAKMVQEYRPTHVAIEDFTEQGKIVGKTYKEMSWMTEHFRVLSHGMDVDLSIYENAYWKKVLTGAMRLSKEQIQHYISHKLPAAVPVLRKHPDHVWDAVGIGMAKWKLLTTTPEEPLTRR